MLHFQKLKELNRDFREYYDTNELQSLLECIIQNPKSIVNDLQEIITVLINLFCYKQTNLASGNVVSIKLKILEIFINSIKHDDIAWYLVEHIGIISILFNEFCYETDNSVRNKMLKCFESYLLFEEFENKIFGECQDFCCNLDSKRVIDKDKIVITCQSIVKSLLLLDCANPDYELIENHLSTLSLICRRFSVDLSLESCGKIEIFNSFKKFMKNVCESDKYSPISAISALSCFYHTSSNKSSFSMKNSELVIEVIYRTLTIGNNNRQSSTYLFGTLLFIDVLQNQTIVDLIRREWSVNHFKSICKLLVFESPPKYVQKMLELLCMVKNIIPEFGAVIENYLVLPNSRLFEFLNTQTSSKCDRTVIMAWRVLQIYFQPTKIDINATRDYCSLITNCVKANLSATRTDFDEKPSQCSNELQSRFYRHSASRALAAMDMLLTMTKHSDFSGYVANIISTIQLMPVIESLVKILTDEKFSSSLLQDVSTAPYVNTDLCDSNNWFLAGSRLTVSLVYFGVSMSFTHSNSICKKNFNLTLMKKSFMNILVTCLTHCTSNIYVERSVVLVTVSGQLPDYDVVMSPSFIPSPFRLAHLITTSTRLFYKSCQNHCSDNRTKSSSSFVDEITLKYSKNTRAIIDSWINNKNKSFTDSEVTMIFGEEIKNLRDHQVTLEKFIEEKENYIRHSNNLVNEYQMKATNSENRFMKLMMHSADVQNRVDQQKQSMATLSEQLDRHRKEITKKEEELSLKNDELEKTRLKFLDLEQKYKKESEKRAEVEQYGDNLRNLLAKSEESLKEKSCEIARLQNITKVINELTGNKVSPDAVTYSLCSSNS